MLIKDEAIVIRTQDYGETHQVVVLYTRNHGKVPIMAYGVKKLKSRSSGVVQLLTHGQYLFYTGSGMGTFKQGEVITSHSKLRSDILFMSYAAYIVELLDRLTEDKEPNGLLFHLLAQTFSFLEMGKDADVLCRIFEMKLLSIAGYRPQLEACIHCGERDKPYLFSVAKGGLLCIDCHGTDEGALVISAAAVRLLRLFLHIDIDRLGEIDVKQDTNEQLERVMYDYTDYHTDLHLKSRSFLQKMKRMA